MPVVIDLTVEVGEGSTHKNVENLRKPRKLTGKNP